VEVESSKGLREWGRGRERENYVLCFALYLFCFPSSFCLSFPSCTLSTSVLQPNDHPANHQRAIERWYWEI